MRQRPGRPAHIRVTIVAPDLTSSTSCPTPLTSPSISGRCQIYKALAIISAEPYILAMDPVRNPYSPGAGTRPPALVGRDKQLKDADTALQRLRIGRDGRGQLLTGLRGVGKTVLLNEFERIADTHGFFHAHIEVAEDGVLAARLATAMRTILLQMVAKKRVGARAKRALGVLKAFSIKLPDGPEVGLDIEAVLGSADSGDLGQDLAGLFVEVGEVARDHDCGVLITIDELQYVPLDVLAALVVGLHRANQLGLRLSASRWMTERSSGSFI